MLRANLVDDLGEAHIDVRISRFSFGEFGEMQKQLNFTAVKALLKLFVTL